MIGRFDLLLFEEDFWQLGRLLGDIFCGGQLVDQCLLLRCRLFVGQRFLDRRLFTTDFGPLIGDQLFHDGFVDIIHWRRGFSLNGGRCALKLCHIGIFQRQQRLHSFNLAFQRCDPLP